jgi:hypothetical protein
MQGSPSGAQRNSDRLRDAAAEDSQRCDGAGTMIHDEHRRAAGQDAPRSFAKKRLSTDDVTESGE